MSEGDFLRQMCGVRIVELEQALAADRARLKAVEESLAFERSQRDQANQYLIELGRQAIASKDEANRLQISMAMLEGNMRSILAEKVARALDVAYQKKTREIEDVMRRHMETNRSINRQDEQNIKDLLTEALEEMRLIIRGAL
jgi:predicted nuclease with TOPRIM domain